MAGPVVKVLWTRHEDSPFFPQLKQLEVYVIPCMAP